MRILHCSDFHGHDAWFRWLVRESRSADLVCLSGDLIDLFAPEKIAGQIARVTRHLATVSAPLAVCSGNHDDVEGDGGVAWLQSLRRERCWVDGDRFSLGGQDFRCIAWGEPVPAAIPGECWLMHAPPDACATSDAASGLNQGDFESGELCRSGRGPHVIFSGHIHEPLDWRAQVGRTWSFNPGRNLDGREPTYVRIDLEKKLAFRVSHDRNGNETSEPARFR